MKKKFRIGYTSGVFDLFNIAHLNILKKAKKQCNYLIVGVSTDELITKRKIKAYIPFEDRLKIVESVKYVDLAVPQLSMDKMEAWEKFKFEALFVGSNWQGTDSWVEYEKQFAEIGVEIIYIPYTKETTSVKLKKALDQFNDFSPFENVPSTWPEK